VTVEHESDQLHERVRAFADSEGAATESFDGLALEIAQYQARWIPGFRRLVDGAGVTLDSVHSVPAVPCDAFRLARVAAHSPELDAVRFWTSGTTAIPGIHPLRSTRTYRALAIRMGARVLVSAWPGRRVVVALAPHPGSPPTSSLGFMMRIFMEAFDGRALTRDPTGAAFDPDAPSRWLASSGGVDVAGLRRAALLARDRREPLLVLTTAFALVLLLDALSGARLPAPRRTVVMQTGGFKGHTRAVAPDRLRAATARAFRIPKEQVVGEYGMTELSSQLYEGGPPGSHLLGEAGVYLEPPWLRVIPVDPVTFLPVPDGQVGLARIVDLANVDSALVILTQDLVRRRGAGVELVGRRRGAPARGCSLGVEALVSASAGWRTGGVGW